MGDTNFNGRTTVMAASANITPNVQYSIKLIVADQTDRNFDTADESTNMMPIVLGRCKEICKSVSISVHGALTGSIKSPC